MSLFDRLGNVVKAEWNARFGDAAEEREERAYDEESLKEAEEALRGMRPPSTSARAATAAAKAPRAAVTDVVSAYRMLELEKGATLDEVRASYRTLARRYHPRTLSKVPDQAYAAQTVLDALTEALEVLEAHLLPLSDGRRV